MGDISKRKAAGSKVATQRTKAAAAGILGAERHRAASLPPVSAGKAQTGAELVAFFRDSPLVGGDLIIERAQSPRRLIDIA